MADTVNCININTNARKEIPRAVWETGIPRKRGWRKDEVEEAPPKQAVPVEQVVEPKKKEEKEPEQEPKEAEKTNSLNDMKRDELMGLALEISEEKKIKKPHARLGKKRLIEYIETHG